MPIITNIVAKDQISISHNCFKVTQNCQVNVGSISGSFFFFGYHNFEKIFAVPFLFERPSRKYFLSNLKGINFSILSM